MNRTGCGGRMFRQGPAVAPSAISREAETVQPQPETFLEMLIALAREHRPQWSWARLRTVCACGEELPCRKLWPLPRDRGAR